MEWNCCNTWITRACYKKRNRCLLPPSEKPRPSSGSPTVVGKRQKRQKRQARSVLFRFLEEGGREKAASWDDLVVCVVVLEDSLRTPEAASCLVSSSLLYRSCTFHPSTLSSLSRRTAVRLIVSLSFHVIPLSFLFLSLSHSHPYCLSLSLPPLHHLFISSCLALPSLALHSCLRACTPNSPTSFSLFPPLSLFLLQPFRLLVFVCSPLFDWLRIGGEPLHTRLLLRGGGFEAVFVRTYIILHIYI